MKQNIGRLDKTMRLVLAIVIATAGVYYKSAWGALAVVPLLTGAVSFCPLYSFFGINTCKIEQKQ